jgi:hypothetical protein
MTMTMVEKKRKRRMMMILCRGTRIDPKSKVGSLMEKYLKRSLTRLKIWKQRWRKEWFKNKEGNHRTTQIDS